MNINLRMDFLSRDSIKLIFQLSYEFVFVGAC